MDTDSDGYILVSAALYALVAVQYARLIGLLKRKCEFVKIWKTASLVKNV